MGRNPAGAYGPGVNTWDLGLSKSFKIRERFGIQFRWEMFNAFNRKTLDIDSLDKTVTSTTFGKFTGTSGAYPPRVMQAALKITF